jgi:membrane-associated phospholipid phosphatase
MMAGILYWISKWIIGLQRPPMPGDVTIQPHSPYAFELFKGGIRALWNAPIAMGFPSGHTALSFATAHVLAICLPKFKWVFYPLAAVVGLEAIWEYRHYLSDVVAGAGLGILAVHLTLHIANLMMPDSNARKET